LDEFAARVDAIDSNARLEVANAMTGRTILAVPHCAGDDVAAAARCVRVVQPDWAARPVRDRPDVLLRFHDLVSARQDEILDIIQRETRRSTPARPRSSATSSATPHSPGRRGPALESITVTTWFPPVVQCHTPCLNDRWPVAPARSVVNRTSD
jgi:hypothetical protein